MENNDRVSIHQLFCLMLINLMGTSLLNMSGKAAAGAGNDGWISIIIGAGLAVIYGTVIAGLVQNHPDQTIVEMIADRWGRAGAWILGFLFWLILILLAAAELRVFAAIIRQTLLEKTPMSVILISMLGCVVYAAMKGCECRARLAEITLLFILLPLVFLVLFAVPQVNVYQLGPVMVTDSNTLIRDGFRLSLYYIPLCLLQTGGCNVGRMWRDSILKTVLMVIGITMVLNLIVFFLVVGCLGTDMTAQSLWPLMQVMAVIDIPILEIERQDALLMTFWILTEFTLLTSYVFHAGITWQKMNRHSDHRCGVVIAAAGILLASLPTISMHQLLQINDWMYLTAGVLFLMLVPLIFHKEREETHV